MNSSPRLSESGDLTGALSLAVAMLLQALDALLDRSDVFVATIATIRLIGEDAGVEEPVRQS